MEQAMPTIVDATEADVPAIIAMHAQSWLDTYPNEAAGVSREWVENRVKAWSSDPDKVTKRREKVREAKTNSYLMYRIAKDRNGHVVGLIMPYRDGSGQHVGAMYIDKAYYGTGLAQRLMDEIIAWADPKRPLELEVATYNERAKAFYRKYNFEEDKGTERLHDVIPVVKMVRKGESSEV